MDESRAEVNIKIRLVVDPYHACALIATFRLSTRPASFKPQRNPVTSGVASDSGRERGVRKPMRQTLPPC
jgi:hypothetical protein